MPRKTKKRRKLTYAQKMDRDLLKLWAEVVKTRDGKCLKCGATEDLHAHHLISRRKKNVRYEPDNGITLCYRCHFYWWHSKDPFISIEVVKWFESQWYKWDFPIRDGDHWASLQVWAEGTFDKDYMRCEAVLKEALRILNER